MRRAPMTKGQAVREVVVVCREMSGSQRSESFRDFIRAFEVPALSCRNWYSILRTVSDRVAHPGHVNGDSVRAFAVKPAPSARRFAAFGLTAQSDRVPG
jgi:hypothetical protein